MISASAKRRIDKQQTDKPHLLMSNVSLVKEQLRILFQ